MKVTIRTGGDAAGGQAMRRQIRRKFSALSSNQDFQAAG